MAVWHPGEPQPAGHAFLKIFKPKDAAAGIDLHERVSRDFAATRAIHDFLSQWDDAGAARPIACYADLLAIVTEEVAGPTLLEHVQSRAGWWPGAAQIADLEARSSGAGRWLKRFQGFEARDARVSLASLVDYVDIRLRRLSSHRVITGEYRERILRHLNDLAAGVAPADLREVAVHADFALGNILLSGTRTVVLDFAMAGRGSWLHDVSRLYLQLDILRAKPPYRPRVIAALQAALLRGLDPALSDSHPLFRLSSMLHRVNHLGTLALGRETFPANLLSARVQRLHRRWIDLELSAPEGRIQVPAPVSESLARLRNIR